MATPSASPPIAIANNAPRPGPSARGVLVPPLSPRQALCRIPTPRLPPPPRPQPSTPHRTPLRPQPPSSFKTQLPATPTLQPQLLRPQSKNPATPYLPISFPYPLATSLPVPTLSPLLLPITAPPTTPPLRPQPPSSFQIPAAQLVSPFLTPAPASRSSAAREGGALQRGFRAPFPLPACLPSPAFGPLPVHPRKGWSRLDAKRNEGRRTVSAPLVSRARLSPKCARRWRG